MSELTFIWWHLGQLWLASFSTLYFSPLHLSLPRNGAWVHWGKHLLWFLESGMKTTPLAFSTRPKWSWSKPRSFLWLVWQAPQLFLQAGPKVMCKRWQSVVEWLILPWPGIQVEILFSFPPASILFIFLELGSEEGCDQLLTSNCQQKEVYSSTII